MYVYVAVVVVFVVVVLALTHHDDNTTQSSVVDRPQKLCSGGIPPVEMKNKQRIIHMIRYPRSTSCDIQEEYEVRPRESYFMQNVLIERWSPTLHLKYFYPPRGS